MNRDEEERLRDKHLLIAVDQTEDAKRAVLYVASLIGGLPGFRATLMSVLQEPDEDFFKSESERAAWTEGKTSELQNYLEKYRQILVQSGFDEDKVAVRLCKGNAASLAETILSFQCDMSCCTIVVGRQHKSRTEEFLFGSISNQLIHEAKNCAVWVVE